MITVTFSVPDIHCINCVLKLEDLEDDLAGVTSAQASYHNQTLKISYDEKVVNESQIRAAVLALGYTIQ
jgi:copper chaperone CopZ